MGIPIIVSAGETLKRSGATFRATCPGCGEPAKFHEGAICTNVSLFLVISLWDGERPVVQCGECLAIFDEETAASLRASALPAPSLLSRLLPSSRSPSPSPSPSRSPSRPPSRPLIDEAAIDAELAAMKERLRKR